MQTTLIQLPLPLPAFEYLIPEDMQLQLGDFVCVPFGNRKLIGVVWENVAESEVDQSKLKAIAEKIEIPSLQAPLLAFIKWTAAYTYSPPGAVLKMAISIKEALVPLGEEQVFEYVPQEDLRFTAARKKIAELFQNDPQFRSKEEIIEATGVGASVVAGLVELGALATHTRKTAIKEDVASPGVHPDLTDSQRQAADAVCQAIDEGKSQVFVLDGVTGSGKTEVYFEAIEAALNKGQQAVVLFPEIVLTAQMKERFTKRFGFVPTLWHSNLTPKQRKDAWQRVHLGKAKLVLGARSALFLPYENLGLMVVDEEHDAGYKQEEGVLYHARDMAVVRCREEQAPIILASATPSIETIQNITLGKYTHLHLAKRYGKAQLPVVHVVDMRQQQLEKDRWVSGELKQALVETMAKGQQSLLFLNRRGYAPLTVCKDCGFRYQCVNCTSWLVEHRERNRDYLQCHHCGFTTKKEVECPDCKQTETFIACGPGIERLAEEVSSILPEARIALMTSETVANTKQAAAIVEKILNNDVDIIIGTQIVAKGHHFPNLTLVGVIDADLGMSGGDLRASERTFQLLHQVAGRAGREETAGKVYLQSYMPENKVIQALASYDRDRFVQEEIMGRELTNMPPFSRLAALIISGENEQHVIETAKLLAQSIPVNDQLQILGPAPAPLYFLRRKYRYRFLVRAEKNISLQKTLQFWLSRVKTPTSVRIKVDIDPFSFV